MIDPYSADGPFAVLGVDWGKTVALADLVDGELFQLISFEFDVATLGEYLVHDMCPDVVVFEDWITRPMKSRAMKTTALRACSAEVICLGNRIPYHKIGQHEWKKNYGIKGKDESIAHAKKKSKTRKNISHHEADAINMAYYCHEVLRSE